MTKPTLSADASPDGRTLLFPILGDPIGQVHSPAHLTPMLEARGVNALVVPLHVKRDSLSTVVNSLLLTNNVPGLILTLPHKPAAFALCDAVSERAEIIGAVNVMRKTEMGGYFGDHMDGIGYLDSLEQLGFVVANSRALVIGAGGAGSAIAYELLLRGAALVDIVEQNELRAQQLINRLKQRFGSRVGFGTQDPRGYSLIANASTAGMHPEDPEPVVFDLLETNQFVADAITEPAITPLLQHAQAVGCRTMTGADMFAGQSRALLDFVLQACHPQLQEYSK